MLFCALALVDVFEVSFATSVADMLTATPDSAFNIIRNVLCVCVLVTMIYALVDDCVCVCALLEIVQNHAILP